MHFAPDVYVVVFILLCMETPLHGRSGGHTGTAPTVSFGWIARCISAPECVGPFVHLFTHENAVSPCKSVLGNKSYV